MLENFFIRLELQIVQVGFGLLSEDLDSNLRTHSTPDLLNLGFSQTKGLNPFSQIVTMRRSRCLMPEIIWKNLSTPI